MRRPYYRAGPAGDCPGTAGCRAPRTTAQARRRRRSRGITGSAIELGCAALVEIVLTAGIGSEDEAPQAREQRRRLDVDAQRRALAEDLAGREQLDAGVDDVSPGVSGATSASRCVWYGRTSVLRSGSSLRWLARSQPRWT